MYIINDLPHELQANSWTNDNPRKINKQALCALSSTERKMKINILLVFRGGRARRLGVVLKIFWGGWFFFSPPPPPDVPSLRVMLCLTLSASPSFLL